MNSKKKMTGYKSNSRCGRAARLKERIFASDRSRAGML